MKDIRIIDSTLRDGMHAVSNTFTIENVKEIACALDKAMIDTIEIGHGMGLGGSSIQYGRSAASDREYLQAVCDNLEHAKVGVLLIPGIGTIEDLEMAKDCGVKLVRVATHVTEANISKQHIQWAKKQGMEAMGFLMMSHMADCNGILEQAKMIESYGADAVYVVDSAGALIPEEVSQRIGLLNEKLNIKIGFHGHNSLDLAMGNTLAAIEAGAELIDTTLKGLGAAAGNTPTEVLVAVLKKKGFNVKENLFELMDAADDIVAPLMHRPIEIEKTSLTMGYAGVHGSLMLHAKRIADKYDIDVRQILLKLGEMKVVGGQEDTIYDVAIDILENGRKEDK